MIADQTSEKFKIIRLTEFRLKSNRFWKQGLNGPKSYDGHFVIYDRKVISISGSQNRGHSFNRFTNLRPIAWPAHKHEALWLMALKTRTIRLTASQPWGHRLTGSQNWDHSLDQLANLGPIASPALKYEALCSTGSRNWHHSLDRLSNMRPFALPVLKTEATILLTALNLKPLPWPALKPGAHRLTCSQKNRPSTWPALKLRTFAWPVFKHEAFRLTSSQNWVPSPYLGLFAWWLLNLRVGLTGSQTWDLSFDWHSNMGPFA